MNLLELITQCPLAYNLCLSYPHYASDLPNESDWRELPHYYERRRIGEYIETFWHFLERQRISITTYSKEHWNQEESYFYYTCRYSISYINEECESIYVPYSDQRDYQSFDECNDRSLAQAFRFLEMRLYLNTDYKK